jgi:acyl carrier protein phosphodiesterase
LVTLGVTHNESGIVCTSPGESLHLNMNFLAHLALSGGRPNVQIGNFIGDHVKGRDFLKYPDDVQKGILLHRKIDWFTDHHAIPKQGAERLRDSYGRYAGVVVDVFYDHFLAINWQRYHQQTLGDFATQVHGLLAARYFSLPREVRSFVPFLIFNKRLESYARIEGLTKALTIMANYTTLPNNAPIATAVLKNHYETYNNEFLMFWEELAPMANAYLTELDHA